MFMNVEVDIDPEDVLDDMGLDDIVKYLRGHFNIVDILKNLGEEMPLEENINEKRLVDSYWHGDLNLKALLKELGPIESNKIFQEASLS